MGIQKFETMISTQLELRHCRMFARNRLKALLEPRLQGLVYSILQQFGLNQAIRVHDPQESVHHRYFLLDFQPLEYL
jgi:hypothetical protein